MTWREQADRYTTPNREKKGSSARAVRMERESALPEEMWKWTWTDGALGGRNGDGFWSEKRRQSSGGTTTRAEGLSGCFAWVLSREQRAERPRQGKGRAEGLESCRVEWEHEPPSINHQGQGKLGTCSLIDGASQLSWTCDSLRNETSKTGTDGKHFLMVFFFP
ncbi:hypothetical protein CLAIMM_07798 [Cladophialophora immunda]|nr:hypothetical protein CLAIMM_07798 [Cladophialophora immunda]